MKKSRKLMSNKLKRNEQYNVPNRVGTKNSVFYLGTFLY